MSDYADGFDDGKGEKFDELMVEIAALRLNLSVTMEELGEMRDRAEKAEAENAALRKDDWNGTTHYAGCIQAGPKHYECALQEVGRLRLTITDLRVKLEKKEWIGLTGKEMKQCSYDADGFMIDREVAMRAVEAKLKEKNT